ncbi:MAG: alpha/beta hydrolase fold domain-containing protein [Planctomycetota bacterium]
MLRTALAAFLLACLGAVASADEPLYEVDPDAPKLLLMHYMPWYETPDIRDEWGGHWTGWRKQHDPSKLKDNGLPDIWSHYHPLIGTYDSTERDVIECQLLQMKLAGVDGVIADWYGITDTYDYRKVHDATKALFDEAGRLGMQFAACYEDRTVKANVERGKLDAEDVPAHLAETVRWMQKHWFGADHHVTLDGRPLLLNFGPIYVKDAAAWQYAMAQAEPRPMFYALHHLWQQTGADGGFYWYHRNAWEGAETPAEVTANLRREFTYRSAEPTRAIASALPGFRDVYDDPHPVLDHRGGATMRESLDAAYAGDWPIVQLVTWNDYGEGTIIEPTHEFGYLFLEIIQDKRREELGPAFAFTHDDLRLPARLLHQRRLNHADPADLEAIAMMLASGHVADARARLDHLDARFADLPPQPKKRQLPKYITQKDIAYRVAGDPGVDDYALDRCKLDLYVPEHVKDFPTVVFFHAGGLMGGEKFIPGELKRQGIGVVSANYRLSPSAQAPAYIEDAAAAVAWTLDHIAEYGGDPDRVFVTGASAGGYLAAMVGLDKRWLDAHGHDADGLAGIVSITGHAITHFTVRQERGIPGHQAVIDELAPLFHVRGDAPPIFLTTGDRDLEMLGRYEEVAYFARMLKVAGHRDVTFYEIGGHDHGMATGPSLKPMLKWVKGR